MGIPRFVVWATPPEAAAMTEVQIRVLSSESLVARPQVRIDGVFPAKFEGNDPDNPNNYIYKYIMRPDNYGFIVVSATSLTGDYGSALISDAFISGGPGGSFAFGEVQHGLTPFGAGVIYPATLPDSEPLDALDFGMRRGFEGPQIVCFWTVDLDVLTETFTFRLRRKELDYPEDETDGDLVYSGTGSYYSDVHLVDGKVYYYKLFIQYDGTWFEGGYGHMLAIDNQGNPAFAAIDPVIAIESTPPGSPALGDRYLIGDSATGVWAGNEDSIAEWDDTQWVFSGPVDRWLVKDLDTEIWLTYRREAWIASPLKDRLNLYDFMDVYDLDQDKKSTTKRFLPAESEVLQGESFNFDESTNIDKFTEQRFLKIFTLLMGVAQGLIDYYDEAYQLATVDKDMLVRAGALVGYDDFPTLDTSLRRFLISQINAVYPVMGLFERVSHAIEMWLGTGVTYDLKKYAANDFEVNESELAVVTPTPEKTGTYDDAGYFISSLDPESVINFKGLGIFLDRAVEPFEYLVAGDSMLPYVLSATTSAPPPATDGDFYLVPVGASGGWTGWDGLIALYTSGLGWIPLVPRHRDGVIAQDTGDTWVFNATNPLNGFWMVALSDELKLVLEWWLKNYVLPDTTIRGLFEIKNERYSGVESFEGFSVGPLVPVSGNYYRGRSAMWTDFLVGSPPPTWVGSYIVVTGGTPKTGLKELKTDLTGGIPVAGSPQFLSGAAFVGFPGAFRNEEFYFETYLRFPVTWPGPSLFGITGFQWALVPFSLSMLTTGSFNPRVILEAGWNVGSGIKLQFSVEDLPTGTTTFSPQIPMSYLADNQWHKLKISLTTSGFLKIDLDDGYVLIQQAFAIPEVLQFLSGGVYTAGYSAVGPVLDVPDHFMDDMTLGRV